MNFLEIKYLPGLGGSRGAFLIPPATWVPPALFFSILTGDFELLNVGLGTKKLGLESIAFANLSPFETFVDCKDDVVVVVIR